MERTRAVRTASAALLVALLGVLAIPLKLAASPSRLQTFGGPTTTTTSSAPLMASTTEPPPPPPLPVLADEGEAPYVPPDDASAVDDSPIPFTAVPAPAPVLPAAAAPASANVPGAHVKAVVVGIDDYPGDDHDLRSAVADARDMAAALARWGVPATNVLELENGNATASAVRRSLEWLVDNAAPDDTAIFFFSGHARALGFGTQALVGSDGWLLTDEYLGQKLAPLRAHAAWIVLSVCYGGGFTELLAPGRILTAAADANDLAYENSGFNRSYLGQYLVRLGLLQGRAGGPIVQQAVAWAQSYLARDAPDRQLTELDMSSGPISIDGVSRTSEGPPDALPPPGFTDTGEPLPTTPPTTEPPAPPTTACRTLLNLFCPR